MQEARIPRSVFGLIGRSLSHSFSRAYFTEKFEDLKLADHEYRNFEVSDVAGLYRFRESVKYHFPSRTTAGKPEILRGLNVTIPYKTDIIPVLDDISEEAKAIGAVNTIVIEDNFWTGHNTDAYGFLMALRPHLPIKGNALVLGTGGASKAISYALESLQVPYLLVSRNAAGEHQVSYESLDAGLLHDVSLIVNCTPLGTYPNVEQAPALPYDLIDKRHHIFDLVYNPQQTLLMKKAAGRGASVQNGYQMLIHQAERAWQLWNA